MYQLLGPVTPPSQLLNLQVVLQTPDTVLSGDSSLCLGESLESRLVYKRDTEYMSIKTTESLTDYIRKWKECVPERGIEEERKRSE